MQSTEASNSTAQFKRFVVLSFRAAEGVSPRAGYDIRDVLNQLNPEGCWFLNPGSFIVCFSSERSGQARAAECRAAIERLCLAHESLGAAKFGQAEGDLLASFESHGHLSAMPVGAAMSEAWGMEA
jgi:hypothetical protein